MSEFSIDYILNRAGDRYLGTNTSIGVIQRIRLQTQQNPINIMEVNFNETHENVQQPAFSNNSLMFDWLQYSRYHPPKIPRMTRSGVSKRTPGRLPRIPFSPAQLQALETAYTNCNYLSAEEANKLADNLDLTNTRVKIWFQNRRARERREKRLKDESCDSTFSSNASSSDLELDNIDIVE